MLVSDVHCSDSVCLQIVFHYRLFQDNGCNILYYVVYLCCLCILYIVVCIFWRRQWYPTLVLLPGKSHGQRSLVGCSPWGCEESDTTERLHFHALEKEMATHSSVLAWRIPGMADPGGLPSMGSHRVGHD